MIIVSHRLCSIVQCHQILVLDDGRVVDTGQHQELLERCGLYRQLWTQQSRYSDFQAARPMRLPGVTTFSGARS
jgi:ATP-binding cassette subfamily B protein